MKLYEMLITHVPSVFYVTWNQGDRHEMKQRTTYGISFAVVGEVVYDSGNKTIVSNPGNLMLLPKGQHYSLQCTESGLFPVINFELANAEPISELLSFPTTDNSQLLSLFQELENIHKIKAPMNRLRQLALIYQMLSQAVIPLDDSGTSRQRIALQPAIDYLEKHFDEPQLNNTVIAQQSFLSETHFRKLFREEMGITPKQYIQQLRIHKAKELLETRYYSISAVAEMTGYASIYHFSKIFKAVVGCSPSEYQEKTMK